MSSIKKAIKRVSSPSYATLEIIFHLGLCMFIVGLVLFLYALAQQSRIEATKPTIDHVVERCDNCENGGEVAPLEKRVETGIRRP